MEQNDRKNDVRELSATELDAVSGAGRLVYTDCFGPPPAGTRDDDWVVNPWINGRMIPIATTLP